MLGKIEGRKIRGQQSQGCDCWIASLIQWIWVWANSGRWWRTGKPNVLQYMGSQRVRQDWVTEQQQQHIVLPIRKKNIKLPLHTRMQSQFTPNMKQTQTTAPTLPTEDRNKKDVDRTLKSGKRRPQMKQFRGKKRRQKNILQMKEQGRNWTYKTK